MYRYSYNIGPLITLCASLLGNAMMGVYRRTDKRGIGKLGGGNKSGWDTGKGTSVCR